MLNWFIISSQGFFSDKQYIFHCSRSTADVLMITVERVYQALEKKRLSSGCSIGHLESLWQGLAFRSSPQAESYGITGHIFYLIQLFLSNCKMKVILNRHSSTSFRTNMRVPHVPDNTSSQLGIYTDNTTTYSCFDSKANKSDKVKMASDVQNDLKTIVNWGKRWIDNF